jgi:hypothetical protein
MKKRFLPKRLIHVIECYIYYKNILKNSFNKKEIKFYTLLVNRLYKKIRKITKLINNSNLRIE